MLDVIYITHHIDPVQSMYLLAQGYGRILSIRMLHMTFCGRHVGKSPKPKGLPSESRRVGVGFRRETGYVVFQNYATKY